MLPPWSRYRRLAAFLLTNEPPAMFAPPATVTRACRWRAVLEPKREALLLWRMEAWEFVLTPTAFPPPESQFESRRPRAARPTPPAYFPERPPPTLFAASGQWVPSHEPAVARRRPNRPPSVGNRVGRSSNSACNRHRRRTPPSTHQ